MANNFDSNISRKLMRVFLEKFQSKRVLSKNVNTSLLVNAFNPTTGDTVDYKRPTDYKSTRTSDGDISGTTAQSIITGKASAVVQDYITVEVDWLEADQAIKMDQLDQLLDPMATRIMVTTVCFRPGCFISRLLYASFTLTAAGPFGPFSTSKETILPSIISSLNSFT